MRSDHLQHFRCPRSGSALRLVSGRLVSDAGFSYPIHDGVPDFTEGAALTPDEVRTKQDYDRVADDIYDTAVDWQFAALHDDESATRESMIDMLDLRPGARVLEVGCGTGRDSLRLARRLGPDGALYMQDLSSGMVRRCVETMRRQSGEISCQLDYSVSNATALPFVDGLFDAVFHFGGFNQFGDLRLGAAELTRVTRVGGRIVIGDEAVAPWLRGTEFAEIVITNNPLFEAEVPLSVLPECARDVSVRWIVGNCFYVIGYTRGEGLPPLNLDLPHQGWRGGTMRSRYFGRLEGVTPEAKDMARVAAARSGLSVHEWLDQLVRSAAKGDA
jgi:ubiquinone/menaquinone biosynthesis C-methylase UbiE